jgi:3-oxoacyl-[acyl-carrier-protein] synthase-3
MNEIWLGGPAYALGDTEVDHTEIPDLAGRAAGLRIPANAKLWGWGRFYRSTGGLEAMAIQSGRASLAAVGLEPSSIDALVLCATQFPGPSEAHGELVETVLTGIGLGDIPFYGQTLNRCTNLLAALDLSSALLQAGRYRRVLVITVDRVTDEADRLAGYALFCDGAASCVLSTERGRDGWQLLGCASAQETASLEWSKEISAELGIRVNQALLGPHGLKLDEVDGLMHTNIFKPLVVMKELQAGFSQGQLYTDNITRIGHCFSADPLINLVDRTSAGQVRPGGYYLLAASVPGSRHGALLHLPRD